MSKFKWVIIFILLITSGVVLYNKKIDVVIQEVKVDGLPDEFDNFTILQLADLHNKSFGKNQKRLVSKINKLDYDIIGITGDMQNKEEEEYDNFIALLENIQNKDEVYYTPGNHGPFVYEGEQGFSSFLIGDVDKEIDNKLNNTDRVLTPAGQSLQDLGVKFLEDAYVIKRGDKELWLSERLTKDQLDKLTYGEYKDNVVNVALTHYPMNEEVYESELGEELPDYDVIIAGHYHGGQWRIPGIGAVKVPNIIRNELFPEDDTVSGLKQYGNFNQYISRGLGAGGEKEIHRFRLFNRPEINIIKLIK